MHIGREFGRLRLRSVRVFLLRDRRPIVLRVLSLDAPQLRLLRSLGHLRVCIWTDIRNGFLMVALLKTTHNF